ncbi:hypothetical protein PMIT1313_01500 [Prochlorococcus marinus str. MIT 1313]|nr:hypothetical protein PMIT1313_01500 [Prochlorococcus marinus str. MIT 1313]KZR71942.1 hypothetical protein PMIT1318_01750 [Prochlorococcus marinus str. MIT 1318]
MLQPLLHLEKVSSGAIWTPYHENQSQLRSYRRSLWPRLWGMTWRTVVCDVLSPFKTRKKTAKSGSARSGKVANVYAAVAELPIPLRKGVIEG